MGRVLKYLFYLVVLGLLALVGYSLVAELPPPTREVVIELQMPNTLSQ